MLGDTTDCKTLASSSPILLLGEKKRQLANRLWIRCFLLFCRGDYMCIYIYILMIFIHKYIYTNKNNIIYIYIHIFICTFI